MLITWLPISMLDTDPQYTSCSLAACRAAEVWLRAGAAIYVLCIGSVPSAEYGFGFALKCRDCNHTVVVIALAWFQINHVFDTESRSIHSLWLYAEYCRIYFLVPDRPRLRYEACYFTRALVARRLAGFLLAWSQSTMLFGTLFTSTAAARRQVQMIPWQCVASDRPYVDTY